MKRKTIFVVPVIFIIATLFAVALLFRPISIQDGAQVITTRIPAWSVGQALQSSGFHIDPHDRVTPGLDRPIPVDGNIIIERAVQAYLWDDEKLRPITGLERTPRGLLSQAGVSLADGDRLLWNGVPLPIDAQLPVAIPLVLQIDRASSIELDSDGQRSVILSHAPTVAGALWDAEIQIGPGDWLSIDPGSQPEPGAVIGYRAARPVIIQTSEHKIGIYSAAETIGGVLAEAGASLQGLDYSQPGEDQPVPEDGIIRIVRVREEISLSESLVPYDSQYAPDPELELDQVRLTQPGQYGVQVARERVVFEDGQEISRGIDSDWVAAEPVAETIGYGTMVVTRSEDTPDGTIEYWRKIRVYATSYSPCRLGTADNRCSYTTASGMRLTKGIVGVSLTWFRMMVGQRVYIPGYGFGVIGDYGALRGMWIDLGFDEENFEEGAIVGWVDMYFLTPVPATIPWTLP